jgi:hypothetical protein
MYHLRSEFFNLRIFWGRRSIAQCSMRLNPIVFPAPVFDYCLGLPQRVEYLSIEQFIQLGD